MRGEHTAVSSHRSFECRVIVTYIDIGSSQVSKYESILTIIDCTRPEDSAMSYYMHDTRASYCGLRDADVDTTLSGFSPCHRPRMLSNGILSRTFGFLSDLRQEHTTHVNSCSVSTSAPSPSGTNPQHPPCNHHPHESHCTKHTSPGTSGSSSPLPHMQADPTSAGVRSPQ